MSLRAGTDIDWADIRRQFMLPPGHSYLNAGTFSALPRPVYLELISLIATAEADPTRVAARRSFSGTRSIRARIAYYVGADPLDIVFHVNITQALGQALFCLEWPAAGEMLISDREYPAIVNAMREMARQQGLKFRTFPLPPRPASDDEVLGAVLSAVSSDTVCVLVSHIAYQTGLILPVARIATALRERDIRLIVDGAHGPGLLPLGLGRTDIDIYGGNLHKWFMGPKGTAFLYVNRRLHRAMQPCTVGWSGTMHDAGPGDDACFSRVFSAQGMRDASPYLALGATLRFRSNIGEERIRDRVADLAAHVRARLEGDLGIECLSPDPPRHAGLTSFRLPETRPDRETASELHDRFRITVSTGQDLFEGPYMRISPHIWSSFEEIDRLAEALKEMMR